MRGSAIPRRWVISLALVGLVSLFAATLTSSWLDPSRASAQTGTGSTPSTILGSVDVSPNNVNLNAGGAILLEARPRNQQGVVSPGLPGPLTYVWDHISGPGASLVPLADNRFATFTTSGTGTAVVQVTVNQGGGTGTTVMGTSTINVVTPAATATTAPPYTNPGPVPSSIPNAAKVITPAAGGTLQSSSDPKISISVPHSATTSFIGVNITAAPATVPPGPNTFRIGSTVVNISFVDAAGNPLTGFRLDRAAEICMPVSATDIATAAGGVAGLKIIRYADPPGQWVELNTTYNPLTGQVCARSSNFSLFAVGLATSLDASEGTVLPATGDTPLSAGLLAFLGVSGVALIGVGAVTLRRSRKAGSAG